MDPKKMYYFIGKCHTLPDNEAEKNEVFTQVSKPDFPWEKFVRMASGHFMVPAVYLRFKLSGLLNELPKELIQYLEYFYNLNFERNIKITYQLRDITELLSRNNIKPIFLKGCANLIDGLYSDAGERMIGDIDFLVQEKNFLKTAELLIEDGYKTDKLVRTKNFNKVKHYPALKKNGGVVYVEIHRNLVKYQHSKRFSASKIFNEKKSIGGLVQYHVPSEKNRAMHNFLHSQIDNHFHYYGQAALRDFYDIYLLSKRTSVNELGNEFHYYRKKLEAWLSLISHTFQHPESIQKFDSHVSRRFIKRINRNLSRGRWVTIQKVIRFGLLKLWIYFVTLINSIFYKSIRSETLGKLRDKNWRRAQIQSYRRFFNIS